MAATSVSRVAGGRPAPAARDVCQFHLRQLFEQGAGQMLCRAVAGGGEGQAVRLGAGRPDHIGDVARLEAGGAHPLDKMHELALHGPAKVTLDTLARLAHRAPD